MKPPRPVTNKRMLQFSEGQWDRDFLVSLGIFVPAAVASGTLLVATQSRSPTPFVRRLAMLGMGLVPVLTFAVIVHGLVEGAVSDAIRSPSPTVVDAAVLLCGAGGAVAIVFAPLVALPVGLGGPMTLALALLGYIVVPFWLGARLLDGVDQFETSMLTVLLSFGILGGAGGTYGMLQPLSPGAELALAFLGVGGLFVAITRPWTGAEDDLED